MALYTFDTDIEKLEFADVFQRIHVILSVLNSRDLVKLEDFRPYCLKTHIKWNKLFHWMKDNETMHAVLGGVFLIVEIDGLNFSTILAGSLESD